MDIDDFIALHKKHKTRFPCVYFLECEGEVVYIGRTNSPSSRVYAHKKGDKKFDGVSLTKCTDKNIHKTEREMILKYSPKYNIQIPSDLDDYDKVSVQIEKLTRKKLKEVSDKRKETGKYPNKQIEILTDFINKLHEKEIINDK